MLRFHPGYFFLTLMFLSTEILIALFVNDHLIRPYLGDMLVVVLMYCFIRSFLKLNVNSAILMVLAIAFIVECMQYFNFLKLVGLESSAPVKLILGNTFSLEDLAMYLLGGFLIFIIERLLQKRIF